MAQVCFYYAVGIGCRSGADAAEMLSLIEKVLADHAVPREQVALLATIASRSEEAAVRASARYFALTLTVFDAATLERETPRLANPSDVVFAATGCHGVAESAALAAGGPGSVLIVEKQRSASATVAIVRYEERGGSA